MSSTGTAFGCWLREQRKARGLPLNDLAAQVGCSRMTILKIETGERRPSGQIAALLAAALGVPAAEQPAFIEFARAALPVQELAALTARAPRAPWQGLAVPAPALPPHNLPAPATGFIGRAALVAQAGTLLGRPGVRLLTLTGPPGIGKTRLSLEVAGAVLGTFAAGVRWVPLAPVRTAALVPAALAAALDVRESPPEPLVASLCRALRDQHLLLVLDNFEHLWDAAPLVGELLAAAPRLQVLVSSRAALRLYGEHELAVPPLTRPDPANDLGPSALLEYEAVCLFQERAQAVQPGFTVTAENGPAVAVICVGLDGLPLAIELAAAQLRTLTPAAIQAQMAHRLDLLVAGPRNHPPRQQTLRGAIAWSEALLTPAEQRLLARLAVFVGGWTLAAAQVVTEEPTAQVAASLTALVDKNLVRRQATPAGEAWFGMLETIREYAGERLAARGETAAMQERHAGVYLELAEAAAPELKGPQQAIWLERLQAEHDNLRAALAWALHSGAAEIACRLGAALWRFWLIRGHLSEGRDWLRAALALAHPPAAEAAAVAPAVLANAYNGAANLAYAMSDYPQAAAWHEASLAGRRALGDQQGMAGALNNLGVVWRDQGDLGRAAAALEESLVLKRALGDTAGVASSLTNLGAVRQHQGDFASARAASEESLHIWRALGDQFGIATALTNLGVVLRGEGEYAAARPLHEESLAIRRALGDRLGIATSLANLAHIAAAQGALDQATQLQLESLALRRALGDKKGIGDSLHTLGRLARCQGDLTGAAAHLRESLLVWHDLGNQHELADCLGDCAVLAAAAGQPERTARLAGAAATLAASIGFRRLPTTQRDYDQQLAAVRCQLDPAAWERAWEAGQRLPQAQLLVYALEELAVLGAGDLPGTEGTAAVFALRE